MEQWARNLKGVRYCVVSNVGITCTSWEVVISRSFEQFGEWAPLSAPIYISPLH